VGNYIYQAAGLIDASGVARIDLSRQVLPTLYEQTSLSETAGLGAMNYRARWYVPQSSSFLDTFLGTTVVKNKHCPGTPLADTEAAMVRVDSQGVANPLDWNANGLIDPGFLATPQDLNFNGGPRIPADPLFPTDGPFAGFNDWNVVNLQQVAGRRNAAGLSLDIGFNDLANGLEDGGLEDGGLEDGGLEDGGLEDGGLEDGGNEMDVVTATASGNAPSGLKATGGDKIVTLTLQPPNVGNITQIVYKVYRATDAITSSNLPTQIGTTSGTSSCGIAPAPIFPAPCFVDTTAKNNTTYTYLVVAVFDQPPTTGPPFNDPADQQSGPSNQATCNYKQSACQP
jgi:hypothetical protein